MRLRRFAFAAFMLTQAAVPGAAQTVRYEVSVASAPEHLFHLSAAFPTGGLDTLLVSLPAWSPGNYVIQNYARYVRHFAARDAGGRELFWDRLDKDTWRIPTGGSGQITVAFDYLADAVDLSQSRLESDFGEILGTNVFLYQEGRLDRPAEVRFHLPDGWRVATALPAAGDGYRAADYDQLADAETFVGHFSLDSLQVDGKWIRIALYPASDYTAPVARALRYGIAKQAAEQNRMMGGAPYDVYTVFFEVYHQPIQFGGGLEHASAQFDIMPYFGFTAPGDTLGPFMRPLTAHEFFHLWNVKRIRPAGMWPYDYHAEQYTPLLWWSEGVTDYYAALTDWRAGLWTDSLFLDDAQSNIAQVASAPEPWSEEDGSVATWINEVFVNSSQLYYPKGSLTGLLLDISIRDATDNRHSLDEVMRNLFTRYYKQGRGFHTADLLALLTEAGMPNVDDFYQRYINGREPLPYATVLAKAGVALTADSALTPLLGVQMAGANNVIAAVTPGSAADEAGIQPGDTVVSVGDIRVSADQDWGSEFRAHYAGKAGTPLPVVVTRDGRRLTLNATVRVHPVHTYRLTRMAHPTAKAGLIWHGLATGSVAR